MRRALGIRIELHRSISGSGRPTAAPFTGAMNAERLPDSPAADSEPPSDIRLCAAAGDSGQRPDVASFPAERTRSPYALARRMNVSVDEAREILQRTGHDFLAHLDRIQPAAWWSWWARTLHHRRCDLAREKKRAQKKNGQAEHQLPALLQHHRSPEAELIRRESAPVVGWFLNQVKPSRREVAERVLFAEGEPYERIAGELRVPVGTVKSRWQRAVEDMRAAVHRRPKEERDWLRAALLALLLVALSVHRWTSTASGVLGRFARRARSRVAPLAACAALSLVVSAHSLLPAPIDAARESSFAGWWNSQEGSSSTLAVLARDPGRVPIETPEATPTASEGDASPLAAPAMVAAPALAETTSPRTVPPAPARSHAPSAAPESESVAPASSMRFKRARALLGRATTSLRSGDRAAAKAALQLYDLHFPDNPVPRHRAELAMALSNP